MLIRTSRPTDPATFTAGEVAHLLGEEVTTGTLPKWDTAGIFRPSFYEDPRRAGGLISRSDRDALLASQEKPSRGDPHRRYTFLDLVWLRFFLQVKNELVRRRQPSPSRRASRLVDSLRARFGDLPPSSLRLVFLGRDAYLVADGQAECLTRPGQRAFSELVLEPNTAELDGRVAVLASFRGLARTTARSAPQRARTG